MAYLDVVNNWDRVVQVKWGKIITFTRLVQPQDQLHVRMLGRHVHNLQLFYQKQSSTAWELLPCVGGNYYSSIKIILSTKVNAKDDELPHCQVQTE